MKYCVARIPSCIAILLSLLSVATGLVAVEKELSLDAGKTGENIDWQVISSGGDMDGVSANFKLSGTVGQTAVESGESDNFGLSHGFWQDLGVGGEECDCDPGDPNADLTTNVADAVYLINYIFKGGPAPIPYPTCSGDPDADCSVIIGDAVYIINFVFKGGPPPTTCEEWVSACGLPLRK